MSLCPHCKEQLSNISTKAASHVRWCKSNPKYLEYKKALKARLDLLTKGRIESNKKNQYSDPEYEISEETKKKLRQASLGRRHTDESKAKIKEKALASNHRRLKKTLYYITESY